MSLISGRSGPDVSFPVSAGPPASHECEGNPSVKETLDRAGREAIMY